MPRANVVPMQPEAPAPLGAARRALSAHLELLLEEANAIAAQADNHLGAAARLLGTLAGLQRVFRDQQSPDDPSSYVMTRVPMPLLTQTLADVVMRDMKHVLASVEAWGELAKALTSDAAAGLKE
jgi:hypothetical protein